MSDRATDATMPAMNQSPHTNEATRQVEYERWLGGTSPAAFAIRWFMGPGQWFANTPLLKLPENLKLDATARVLDLGSGRGWLMRMLDDQLGADTPPVGLDFSREALRLARRDERNPRREAGLVQGSATALPFRAGAFNLILCGHLVKHLDDVDLTGLMLEIRRVLEPGGLALLWEFGPTGNPRLDAWNARVLSTGVRGPRLRATETLKRFARDAGFPFVRDANLRPFLLPPIPRASILFGVPPEGYHGPQ
ncbi:MAG: class I SAM-dependent methyltransferase [Chloroflexi bacterium]|nr:class I SAM-dependent methyltransferase [Chloroflexota bacterium]